MAQDGFLLANPLCPTSDIEHAALPKMTGVRLARARAVLDNVHLSDVGAKEPQVTRQRNAAQRSMLRLSLVVFSCGRSYRRGSSIEMIPPFTTGSETHAAPLNRRLSWSLDSGADKGFFWKRDLFRKVHFLEILEN